jgi:hypothetical protein
MQRIFIKKMFYVYGGKCFSCIAVYNWVEKRGIFSMMTNRLK